MKNNIQDKYPIFFPPIIITSSLSEKHTDDIDLYFSAKLQQDANMEKIKIK
uniref:Uncharacterized protein n=1 Tax=Anguilla anguilla TaxID=7936 RepID=A0A0E9RL02_ANGAN